MASNTPVELARRGIQAPADAFTSLVQDAIQTLPVGPYRDDPSLDLTEQERQVLQSSGMDTRPHDFANRDPLSRTTAEYVALLDACFSVRQAAETLGVTPTRVRQLLTGNPRRLIGIRGRNEWRIPAFQFTKHGLVPGWDEVVPALDSELHPVALLHFATRPHTDLTVGEDESPISPLDWLFAGRDPSPVIELATHL
jgi:hypothetical protein